MAGRLFGRRRRPLAERAGGPGGLALVLGKAQHVAQNLIGVLAQQGRRAHLGRRARLEGVKDAALGGVVAGIDGVDLAGDVGGQELGLDPSPHQLA